METRLLEYPTCIRESICVWEFLRRLKFKADDIYLNLDTTNQFNVYRTSMVVREKGKKDIAFNTGHIRGLKEHIQVLWTSAAERWNAPTTTDTERDSIWALSNVHNDKLERSLTIKRLADRGRLPKDFHYDEEDFDRCWAARAG